MSSKQSYPSPNAAQVSAGAGPFYGQDAGDPTQIPHELQQLQAAELSRSTAPMMAGSSHEAEYATAEAQGMQHATSPERLAQGVLNMSEHDINASGGSRKRSKVSRACDECRRKKACAAAHTLDARGSSLIVCRFDATQQSTVQKTYAPIVKGRVHIANSADSP